MALINCPECKREISEQAQTCPNCGFPIKDANTSQDKQSSPAMLWDSENDEYIYVKCSGCGKAGRIKRSVTIRTNTGYKLKGEAKCSCGLGSNEIYKYIPLNKASKSKEKTTFNKKFGCFGSIIIILSGLILFDIVLDQCSRDRIKTTPPKITSELPPLDSEKNFYIDVHDKSFLSKARIGKELHLQIINSHKGLDKFYLKPYIWGSLTDKPLCCVSVPIKDWDRLTEDKRQYLAYYAASLVTKVKAKPFMYSGVEENAPIAPIILKNIEGMTNESWCIMVGEIWPNGRDIGADDIAISGE